MRNTLRNFRAEDFEEAVEKADEAKRRNAKAAKAAKDKAKSKPKTEDTQTDPNKVPEGTSKEVLAWVDDDPVRAQQALDAEIENEKPRVTLIDELEQIKAKADTE